MIKQLGQLLFEKRERIARANHLAQKEWKMLCEKLSTRFCLWVETISLEFLSYLQAYSGELQKELVLKY